MFWKTLISNPLVNIGAVSWCIAQFLKTVLFFIHYKKFNAKRICGAGGMPSSHSALVCSVATGVVCEYGFTSPYFAIVFAFAVIVMYDAVGVRRSAGEQAKAIHEIQEYLESQGDPKAHSETFESSVNKLNESLGHKPVEVLCGGLLGVAVAMLMM